LSTGWIAIITHNTDTLMSIPMLALALVIAAMQGAGMKNVMVALGVGMIPGFVRTMCGQVLAIKEREYVMASRAGGAGNLRIMLNHVLPNCLPPLIVIMTGAIGMAILAKAGLSFLGAGILPPEARWSMKATAICSPIRSFPLHPELP
jgi:peptide/nickel transport system permease protein